MCPVKSVGRGWGQQGGGKEGREGGREKGMEGGLYPAEPKAIKKALEGRRSCLI